MQTKTIGLSAIVLITLAIIGYKSYFVPTTQVLAKANTPRVLMVANLSEADEEGDACAEIIHLVRAAHARGIDVEELNVNSQSSLIPRYHILITPTVLIFDAHGEVMQRFEGESGDVRDRLRTELAGLQ